MDGDYIIPGLVELHTDHLEGHYAPRPKVRWNPIAAVLAHDAQVATAGITTVLRRLARRHGRGCRPDRRRHAQARRRDRGQRRAGPAARRPFHPSALRGFGAGLPARLSPISTATNAVKLASLMDHAPGQRQFAKLETYAMYYQGKLKMTGARLQAVLRKADGAIGEEFGTEPGRDLRRLPRARHRAGKP